MKIAYVITRSDAIGGAQVHVRDLARTFVAQGHEVTLLVGGEGVFTRELTSLGIRWQSLRFLVRPIHPVKDVAAMWEIRRHLLRDRPDLVSAHSSKAGWLARIVGHALRLPVVFTAHGWAFTEGVPEHRRRMYALAERAVGRYATRIITVSDYDRYLALRHRVAPPEKIVTVHNGVPDVDPGLWANPAGYPPAIIMVGRFEPPKDQLTLVSALASLTAYPWSLKLVGDGPMRERVSEAVQRFGLGDRVQFLGRQRDVAQHLATAQLFVLSSNWEGLPLTILEAMRAKLPVVASDVGGVKEAVVHGHTGFLVPKGDVSALANRLRQLLTDPVLRVKMGEKGRQRYESHFRFEQMLQKTTEVYEAAVADARRKKC